MTGPLEISTLFLDAGGVLCHPSWTRVSAALAREGVDITPAALAAAEPRAKRDIDEATIVGATDDKARGWLYFNKVLEHVEDPVAMLARSSDVLAGGGVVYVEVPDGEAAAVQGPEREEFFIEHHHVFSLGSLAMTAARAGLSPLALERLREPSSKFTLRAFLAR